MSDPASSPVFLKDGPQDGRVISDDNPPGIIIVMPRIPEDGPMVNDRYRLTSAVLDGITRVAVFVGTEEIPESPVWPDERDEAASDDAVLCELNRIFKRLGGIQDQLDELRESVADLKKHAEETI
jgi:hypothetical protein